MAHSQPLPASGSERPPGSLAELVSDRRRLPAWAMSLTLHLVLLVLLTLVLQLAPRGAAIEAGRPGGIVLARQQQGAREYFDADSDRRDQKSQEQPKSVAAALPSLAEAPRVELAGVLPSDGELVGLADDLGKALPDAGDLTGGVSRSKVADGSVRTEVFGVAGQGSKFIYVFDRSGSMDGFGGRPLAAAQSELIMSLDDLEKTHQFQIIFYNERPRIFNPTGGVPRLVWGNERGKTLAERFVRGIVATGGTRHMEALELAVKMRPDVIFFLTDADEPQLSPGELADIRRMNRADVTINTIEFGFGPFNGQDNFLVKLARKNHGRHVYVDVSSLGRGR